MELKKGHGAPKLISGYCFFSTHIVTDFSRRSHSSKTVRHISSSITVLPTGIAGFEHGTRHTDDLKNEHLSNTYAHAWITVNQSRKRDSNHTRTSM